MEMQCSLKAVLDSGVDVRIFLVRLWPGGRHPKGAAPDMGAANVTEHFPTRHQPMTILVMREGGSQPRGGTQQIECGSR